MPQQPPNSTEQPQQTPMQPGQIQSGTITAAQSSTDMVIRFSEGERTLPGWIVAHLGGNAEVEKQRGDLAHTPYTKFVNGFFEEAGAQTLRGMQKAITARHLSNFNNNRQQFFRPGR